MGWFLKLLKEVRGNAIWDFAKWVFRNRTVIIPAIVGLSSGFVGWLKNQPLLVLIVLVFGVGVLTYLGLLLLEVYLKEDSDTQFDVPKNQPTSDRETQGASVALDELKKMLRQGEKMVDRFSDGEHPTLEEITEYRSTTLAAAKWRVFERVTLEDIERFEEDWDEKEVLLKKAALLDAGRLPRFAIDPEGFLAFDRLYGRVERLRELIGVITGKVPHAMLEPPVSKVASKTPPVFPSSMLPTPQREPGPRNVPPKRTHADWEREQAEKGISIHPPRSGKSIIGTVESRMREINEFLKKYEPLLEHVAKTPSSPPPNIPVLLEIEDDLIQHCFAVEMETGGTAFREMAKHFGEVNLEIFKFNKLRTPGQMNQIRKLTEQIIPEVITRAKQECA